MRRIRFNIAGLMGLGPGCRGRIRGVAIRLAPMGEHPLHGVAAGGGGRDAWRVPVPGQNAGFLGRLRGVRDCLPHAYRIALERFNSSSTHHGLSAFGHREPSEAPQPQHFLHLCCYRRVLLQFHPQVVPRDIFERCPQFHEPRSRSYVSSLRSIGMDVLSNWPLALDLPRRDVWRDGRPHTPRNGPSPRGGRGPNFRSSADWCPGPERFFDHRQIGRRGDRIGSLGLTPPRLADTFPPACPHVCRSLRA